MKKMRKFSKGNQKKDWKGKQPILVGIGILTFMIIVVPTIIVMIPQSKQASYEAEEILGVFLDQQIKEPTFNVSVRRSETGEVDLVPLEEYVLSVVASEMPATFADEALKAQAVAARTYIVNYLLQQTDQDENVITDTTEHQVYKSEQELKSAWGDDFHWKLDKVKKAVDATKGEIITYNSTPITPTFFSMSNGYTENAEDYWGTPLPYLKKVESKWEESLPNFSEQKVFTIDEMNEKLGMSLQKGQEIPMKIKRTSSERVKEIEINEAILTGREVREKLGLRSNDFTITQKNDHFLFTTKGYGHGVGMSQYGANEMANNGKDYAEVIHYYYQDVAIESISQVAPTLIMD